jgi:BirA family transcriptional regulator, biotin operon repressor / biotin---[acetyl-CoA-carboxylase] ligase
MSCELELLNKKIINSYIDAEFMPFCNNMLVVDEISSTSAYLADIPKTTDISICFAESQSVGKGRLGRNWFSPYGRNIYLSAYWKFAKSANELSGLSLAIAIAVVDALKQYGIEKEIFLKWPNDVFWQKRKLAGILVDLTQSKKEECKAIIGVGLNVDMPKEAMQKIDQPWCDIAQITKKIPQRNKLAGLLLNSLLKVLTEFQKNGFKLFLEKWLALDITYGKKIVVTTSQYQEISGIGYGVDNRGHFLLKDTSNNILSFAIGEINIQKSFFDKY